MVGLTYTRVFPFMVALDSIACVISLLNIFLSIRHSLRIGRPNLYNIALCVCSLLFTCHATLSLTFHVMGYRVIKGAVSDENNPERLIQTMTRMTWSLASILYLLIVQSRLIFLFS